MARADPVPMLVAGGLLLILGMGLFSPAQAQLAAVPTALADDPAGVVAAEIARADKVLNDYRIAVSRVFPLIIALCALAKPQGCPSRLRYFFTNRSSPLILRVRKSPAVIMPRNELPLLGPSGRSSGAFLPQGA